MSARNNKLSGLFLTTIFLAQILSPTIALAFPKPLPLIPRGGVYDKVDPANMVNLFKGLGNVVRSVFKGDLTEAIILPFTFSTEPVANENSVSPVNDMKLTNYPNPFNPTTTINFSNTKDAKGAKIEIYNVKGQKVVTLSDPSKSDCIEGRQTHNVVWNGTDSHNNPVSSGVYFAVLKSGDSILANSKMMLLKS